MQIQTGSILILFFFVFGGYAHSEGFFKKTKERATSAIESWKNKAPERQQKREQFRENVRENYDAWKNKAPERQQKREEFQQNTQNGRRDEGTLIPNS